MLNFQGEFKGQTRTKLHKLILNGDVEEVEKLLTKGTGKIQLFLLLLITSNMVCNSKVVYVSDRISWCFTFQV